MQVAEKDGEGREVARRYVLDPKDKELVSCRRCRYVAAPPAHPPPRQPTHRDSR